MCQSIYKALGDSKKVLVTLGLNVSGQPSLIDINEAPWYYEPSVIMNPSNKELATEDQCRQQLFSRCNRNAEGESKPLTMKPKHKPREKLIEWLNDWPSVDLVCVEYLTSEATRVRNLLQSAIDEGRSAWCMVWTHTISLPHSLYHQL